MSVITCILKVIGFLVLFTAGVLLLLVILLLFVPLRYRVKGCARDDKYTGEAFVRWLFGALSFQAGANETGMLTAAFRVLCFTLWTYEKQLPFSKKEAIEEPSTDLTANLPREEAEPKINPVSTPAQEQQTRPVQLQKVQAVQQDKTQPAEQQQTQPVQQQSVQQPQTQPAQQPMPEGKFGQEQGKKAQEPEGGSTDGSKKTGESLETIRKYKDFFMDPKHREVLSRLYQKIRKVLQELKPTDGQGELCFGSGDPYTTGQILEVFAFFYPFYGEFVKIVPFFDRACLEAQFELSGRFRLWVAALTALQIYFSKDARALLKEFRGYSENG